MTVVHEDRRVAAPPDLPTARSRRPRGRRRSARPGTRVARRLISVAVLVLVWFLAARAVDEAILFPPPDAVWATGVEMIQDGSLPEHAWASIVRILVGFAIGTLIAVPIGLLMGSSPMITDFLDPYVEFFRFIPALSLVTLALIWFGPGEPSKYFLLAYATSFVVIVNTIAGVAAVPQAQRRAAVSLGANRVQAFLFVTLPASVPFILTGMRIAMSYAFATIVAAEMVAAQSGLGYLIFSSRLLMQTDQIFVGIIALGALGYVADRILRQLSSRLLRRYVEHVGA